jgi:hypothetical protein
MFALPPLGNKKTFSQKGFCGAFSLKKRPLRPQALPPINQNLKQRNQPYGTTEPYLLRAFARMSKKVEKKP